MLCCVVVVCCVVVCSVVALWRVVLSCYDVDCACCCVLL